MSDNKEAELTPEAREAIRGFILKLLAIPAVITSLLAFILGYLINNVARNDAYTAAYQEASKELRAIIAEAASGRTEVNFARDSAAAASKEAAQSLAAARRLKIDFETLTNPEELRRQLANQLANDVEFKKQLLIGADQRFTLLSTLQTKVSEFEAALGPTTADASGGRISSKKDGSDDDGLITLTCPPGTYMYGISFGFNKGSSHGIVHNVTPLYRPFLTVSDKKP